MRYSVISKISAGVRFIDQKLKGAGQQRSLGYQNYIYYEKREEIHMDRLAGV